MSADLPEVLGEDADRIIAEAIASCPDNCGSAAWRGRNCQYHQGVIDGAGIVLELLDSDESGTQ